MEPIGAKKMNRVYEFDYQGKKMFCLDLSDMNVGEKEEFKKLVVDAKQQIRLKPAKSALIITNVTNTGFDTEIAGIIKEYAQHNTPYVKASAVVGINGLGKIILNAIKILTKREFHLADTLKQAQDWLVKQ